MKKLLIGVMALVSISSFAAEVCIIKEKISLTRISCNGREFIPTYDVNYDGPTTVIKKAPREYMGKRASGLIQLKLDEGYELSKVNTDNSETVYVLIRN
jgi:hypothetical protein